MRINRTRLYKTLKSFGASIVGDTIAKGEECTYEFVPVYEHSQSSAPWGWFDVQVRKHTPKGRKTSAHRVFVKCHSCGGWIPAGRIGQHSPSCEKRVDAAYDRAARAAGEDVDAMDDHYRREPQGVMFDDLEYEHSQEPQEMKDYAEGYQKTLDEILEKDPNYVGHLSNPY